MSCVSAATSAACRAAAPASGRAASARRAANAPAMAGRKAMSTRTAAAVGQAATDLNAVTVADTKARFIEAYPFPIPSIWSVALQELLVTQHFVRYSIRYNYSKLSSLGFVSVYDQLFEGFPSDEEKAKIFECFVEALSEDPKQVRADAAEMAAFAESAGSVDKLVENPMFASMKALNDDKKFAYSRYDAIGLFRMLELAAATDPAALEKMATASGLQLKKVNGDLGLYKGLLSKLAAAKELQQEILEREQRKQAERDAKKAEKAKAAAEASA